MIILNLMDNKDFDPKLFFRQQCRSQSSVKDLITLNNKLCSETKTLENDLHTLVYDNYSKFVEASDMMSNLGASLDSLENDLAVLTKTTEACD